MSAEPTSSLPAVSDADHAIGAESPQLTLVEYGDFGCPFCLQAKRPLMSLLDRFEGLCLVWRHLPDPDLHPGADLAAELSELAAAHGKFWEAHAQLLVGREKFSPEDLRAVARDLGLDVEEADAAIDRRAFRARVEEVADGGRRAGARGTPTFFVDGERLEGQWRQLAQIVPERIERSG